MADTRDLPLLRWGEDLRRSKEVRRDRHGRTSIAALTAAAAILLAGSLVWRPDPRLVWNRSASAPLGLYAVQPGAGLRAGDTVLANLPSEIRGLAAKRGYLPDGVPLLKRVAAIRGDRVCAIGESVWINGRRVGVRLQADAAGRLMPWWSGCPTLVRGEYFLMGESAASFDGRYFGLSTQAEVIGRAVPLSTR